LLKLRRGVVAAVEPLQVRVGDEERRAWADEGLVGEMREGDEVIVNVEALDLGLGSGGFDVVHVNLTRGLDAVGAEEAPAMKLNYTSLQHPVDPVEARSGWGDPMEGDNGGDSEGKEREARRIPVLVLSLHGQLAPAAWAACRAGSGIRVGYVQTTGGALPGSLSEDVAELRNAELLCGHVTAGSAFGGELEAVTVIGALQAAAGPLGWDAVIAGPGPGISGSGSALGHGGLVALDTAHASLILGFETLLAPRMSSGDPRPRHRGLSHHTETVLRLLLGNVRVPAPASDPRPWPTIGDGQPPLAALRRACGDRHEVSVREAPINEYAASGLQATHMGRPLADDGLFFASALAAGDGLAAAALVEVP
jgi:Protein of unknown function (DUF3866)